MLLHRQLTAATAICALALTGPAPAQDDDGGWFPEALYEPQMGDTGAGAAPDLAAWAKQPQLGPEGRPLPLTGSWMAEGMFSPIRFVELVKRGHHVLPTFLGVSSQPIRAYQGGDARQRQRLEEKLEKEYRPALEFAREHNLPIAIREWNWSSMPPQYQQLAAQFDKREVPLGEDLRVIVGGKPGKATDPFGPLEGWRAWGTFWFDNPFMRMIQQIYPNPPLVIFLDNNEGPKVRSAGDIPADYPRLIAFLGGTPPADQRTIEQAIRAGYAERYAAMFEAARAAMIEPAWKKNVRFVAYNTLWDTGYIGEGGRPKPGIGFDPDQGWLTYRMFDGSMPELYDNDWQPGKTDFRPHSPQTEAMNYFAAQAHIFARDPDFYWSAIIWDGERPGNAWRGRRSASKTYTYATRGQRWDFARYEGWAQFALWTTRPREYREFRGGTPERHAHMEGTFRAVLDAVDRPWANPVLREFWRFGELVPNRAEPPWFNALDESHPQWVRDLDRWYLLTCDANPPRDTWENNTVIRVFAQALRLGQAPERRWLIYAHAPLGAVPNPTVIVPEHGPVVLPSVPKSGSFFLLEESKGTLELVLAGGPDELNVTADRRQVAPGEPVTLEAKIAHAPGKSFAGFAWNFGDGQTLEQATLAPVTHTFAQPGEYLVAVDARLADGGTLREQVAIQVGQAPAATVIYDLSLATAFDWQGPWDAAADDPARLLTYRHLPNRGRAPNPALVGGQFVDDPERGRVLAIDSPETAVWLIRNADTVMDQEGHPDYTLSLRFKAEDTGPRQVLYAQGHQLVGFNIYLHEGHVYAGCWAPVDGKMFDWFPVPGRNFPGHWLSAPVEAGRWTQVTLVLRDATTQVQNDKLHLYIDGQLVASGPGVRIPRQYGIARLGLGPIDNNLLMRFHDGETDHRKVAPFRGRLANFRLTHDATPPATP